MNGYERLIADFRERSLPEMSPRLTKMPEASGLARVVIGMRRSGKTYFMYQQMQRLLDEGVDKGRLLYINFEDDRLRPFGPNVLDEVLETFYRTSPAARVEGAHLFFDEIQVVDGWPRFARRVLDTEAAALYVSGSSAKMLSTEVATEFRGRGLSVELLPMSFAETLLASGLPIPTELPGSRLRSQIEAEFATYLRAGGFPAVRAIDESERISVLQDYVELVLLRDVIERHGLRNAHAVRYFALSLLQSVGSPTSVNRIANDMKSRGIAVGRELLYSLRDHFTDAFLLFTVPVFDRSLRVRESNPRKVYSVDPGLAFAVAPAGTDNLGARLENAVYLELRRSLTGTRDGSISYYTTGAGHEVDFVVGDAESGSALRLVQVCADTTRPETREREIRALREAMAETGLRDSTLVTLSGSDTIRTDVGTINVTPAWAWTLGL